MMIAAIAKYEELREKIDQSARFEESNKKNVGEALKYNVSNEKNEVCLWSQFIEFLIFRSRNSGRNMRISRKNTTDSCMHTLNVISNCTV